MKPALSYLANLDYSMVQQCMHCGLCLPTCPTYDTTKVERHSPRGGAGCGLIDPPTQAE